MLTRGSFEPGYHTVRWDGLSDTGRRVPAGIYFLSVQNEGQSRRLKVVVAR